MSDTAEQARSRHPFELLFLFVCVLTSAAGVISYQARPGSIQEGIGPEGTTIWYATLLASSIAALVGIFWRERATGLVLESLGLFIAGICTSFYALSAVILIGGNAIFSGLMLIAYGGAAIWRARDIRKSLATVALEHPGNCGE